MTFYTATLFTLPVAPASGTSTVATATLRSASLFLATTPASPTTLPRR